jgi:hypothetical protein
MLFDRQAVKAKLKWLIFNSLLLTFLKLTITQCCVHKNTANTTWIRGYSWKPQSLKVIWENIYLLFVLKITRFTTYMFCYTNDYRHFHVTFTAVYKRRLTVKWIGLIIYTLYVILWLYFSWLKFCILYCSRKFIPWRWNLTISEFSVHIYAAVPANNYWYFIARYGQAISRLISKAI